MALARARGEGGLSGTQMSQTDFLPEYKERLPKQVLIKDIYFSETLCAVESQTE